MGKLSKISTFTPTLDTSAYTSGDVLFATTAVLGVCEGGKPSVLRAITLVDADDEGVEIDLYFLSENVAMGTINNAPSISDANAQKITGTVNIATTDYKDLGGVKVATKTGLEIPLWGNNTQGIYCAGVVTGTPTFAAANNITIDFWVDMEVS